MNDIDKFKILLPHWIEHNKNHEKEFKKWLSIIENNDEKETASLLKEAVSSLENIDDVLARIADKLGPLPENTVHHHH